MSDLKQSVLALVENIEQMKPPPETAGDLVADARAEGVFQGMTTVASQLRALLEEKPKKPIVPGTQVRITNGLYKGRIGTFKGLSTTPLGAQAEVSVAEFDLPVEVDQKHIEAI